MESAQRPNMAIPSPLWANSRGTGAGRVGTNIQSYSLDCTLRRQSFKPRLQWTCTEEHGVPQGMPKSERTDVSYLFTLQVNVLRYHPHTTHLCQVLDSGLMTSLKVRGQVSFFRFRYPKNHFFSSLFRHLSHVACNQSKKLSMGFGWQASTKRNIRRYSRTQL